MEKAEVRYFVVKGLSSGVVRAFKAAKDSRHRWYTWKMGAIYHARQIKVIWTKEGAAWHGGFKSRGSCVPFLGKPWGSGRTPGSPMPIHVHGEGAGRPEAAQRSAGHPVAWGLQRVSHTPDSDTDIVLSTCTSESL